MKYHLSLVVLLIFTVFSVDNFEQLKLDTLFSDPEGQQKLLKDLTDGGATSSEVEALLAEISLFRDEQAVKKKEFNDEIDAATNSVEKANVDLDAAVSDQAEALEAVKNTESEISELTNVVTQKETIRSDSLEAKEIAEKEVDNLQFLLDSETDSIDTENSRWEKLKDLIQELQAPTQSPVQSPTTSPIASPTATAFNTGCSLSLSITGLCGPKNGDQHCAKHEEWQVYCNEDTGFCGGTTLDRDAQESTKYDADTLPGECRAEFAGQLARRRLLSKPVSLLKSVSLFSSLTKFTLRPNTYDDLNSLVDQLIDSDSTRLSAVGDSLAEKQQTLDDADTAFLAADKEYRIAVGYLIQAQDTLAELNIVEEKAREKREKLRVEKETAIDDKDNALERISDELERIDKEEKILIETQKLLEELLQILVLIEGENACGHLSDISPDCVLFLDRDDNYCNSAANSDVCEHTCCLKGFSTSSPTASPPTTSAPTPSPPTASPPAASPPAGSPPAGSPTTSSPTTSPPEQITP